MFIYTWKFTYRITELQDNIIKIMTNNTFIINYDVIKKEEQITPLNNIILLKSSNNVNDDIVPIIILNKHNKNIRWLDYNEKKEGNETKVTYQFTYVLVINKSDTNKKIKLNNNNASLEHTISNDDGLLMYFTDEHWEIVNFKDKMLHISPNVLYDKNIVIYFDYSAL